MSAACWCHERSQRGSRKCVSLEKEWPILSGQGNLHHQFLEHIRSSQSRCSLVSPANTSNFQSNQQLLQSYTHDNPGSTHHNLSHTSLDSEAHYQIVNTQSTQQIQESYNFAAFDEMNFLFSKLSSCSSISPVNCEPNLQYLVCKSLHWGFKQQHSVQEPSESNSLSLLPDTLLWWAWFKNRKVSR